MELTQPSLFIVTQPNKIIIQVGISYGYVCLNDHRQMTELLNNDTIFLRFDTQEDENLFAKHQCTEITESNVVQTVKRIAQNQLDLTVQYQIGVDEYSVPVQSLQLLELVQEVDEMFDRVGGAGCGGELDAALEKENEKVE